MAKKQDQQRRTFSSARKAAEKHETGFGSTAIKLPEGTKRLQLKEGRMYLDFIPYAVKAGNPHADEGTYHHERTYYVHRGIGPNGDWYICLSKTLGKPCPVCEYRKKRAQNPDVDEEEIRELNWKERQLFNVIDTRNREAGIQVLDLSFHLFGKSLNERIMNDEDNEGWDRFAHPTKGFTLRLTVSEKTMGKNKFLEVTAIDLVSRKEQYKEDIVDKAVCLDDCIVIPKYDKVKKLLLEIEDDDDGVASTKKGDKKKPVKKDKDEDDSDDESEDDESDDDDDDTDSDDESEDDDDDDADEDDDDSDEESDDEDGDEDDDSDSDEDDDSDDEDGDEEKPAKKKPGKKGDKKPADKPAKSGKKKAAKADDAEDDDEDADSDEDADEDDDGDSDSEDGDEDDDDGDEEDSDDETEDEDSDEDGEDDAEEDDDDWDEDDEEEKKPAKKAGKKKPGKK